MRSPHSDTSTLKKLQASVVGGATPLPATTASAPMGTRPGEILGPTREEFEALLKIVMGVRAAVRQLCLTAGIPVDDGG